MKAGWIHFIVGLVLFVLPTISYSQQDGNWLPDTVLLDHMLDEAIEILYSDPDSAHILASDAAKLAEELGYPKYSIRALGILAYVASLKGNYTEALGNDLVSLEMAQNLNDTSQLARVLNNIGNDHLEVRDFVQAHKYFREALTMAEQAGDTLTLSIATLNLGTVLKELDQYEGALQAFERSLEYGKQANDPEAYVFAYMEMGHVWFQLSDLIKAREYYEVAIENLDTIDLPHIETQVLDRYAIDLFYQGDYKSSQASFESALQIAIDLENEEQQAKVLNGMAMLQKYIGNSDLAEDYILQSIELSGSSNKKEIESESYRLLSELYQEKGRNAQALDYFKKHHHLKDSILMAEKKVQISNLELQYDLKMKDLEISALNSRELLQKEQMARQDRLRNILVVLLAFSVVLLYTVYRSGQRRRKINKLLIEHRDEIEKQKDELVELNKVKDKFFSVLAHDLRSPIRSLSGVLKLLESNNLTEAETKQLVGAIGRRTEQTQQLLDNLLEWALIQMDKITVNSTNFDLKDSIQKNIDLMKETTDKQVGILNEVDHIQVLADRNMIDLVIRNLLSNAIKYSHDEGSIKITSERQSGSIIVHIQDHGIGIDKELQEELLEDSSMISSSGTANEKGTGLGLKISKEFIERNGGSIWLESKEGEGSIFSFSIPVAETKS